MPHPLRHLLLSLALAAGLALSCIAQTVAAEKTAIATFGSGCFWCTESDFDKVPGVLETVSGYMGGHVKNPTYRQVSRGGTGHAEVVQITYDPAKVTYAELLDHFWRNVDPFDRTGQFCDRGSQYRPAIFTHSDKQAQIAKKSRRDLDTSGRFDKKIVVEITPASAFTPAESYHQDFYKKNPAHYWRYRIGCRRDERLKAIWGKPAKS
jgi:methionine-S-sulfoxide reductase